VPGDVVAHAVVAAALYFMLVFTVGFALGPVRAFLLEPRLGRTLATLIETPFLLAAIVLAALMWRVA
jgi:hypothetical protein